MTRHDKSTALMAIWRAFLAGHATADEVVTAWIDATRCVGNGESDRRRGLEWITHNPEGFGVYLRSWGVRAPGDAA